MRTCPDPFSPGPREDAPVVAGTARDGAPAWLAGEPTPRWAREDVELGGVAIAARDRVLMSSAGANRDPAVFPDPDGFRADRSPNPHLTFGRGTHHCVGAAVARLELRAAFTALARRLPDLRLAVPPEDVPWTHGHVDSGPTALPVTW
jgi:cytochrome P450